MKKLFLMIVLVFGLITACGGSGGLSGKACEVGAIVCDVSSIICESIPNLPPVICQYLDVACFNLELICALEPDTPEHAEAVEELSKANKRLKKYIQEYKQRNK